jgi:hypothetical protein
MVAQVRHAATCASASMAFLTAFLSTHGWNLAEQPVSRRRIAVSDVVHRVGLLQHAALDLPALGGELPVVFL